MNESDNIHLLMINQLNRPPDFVVNCAECGAEAMQIKEYQDYFSLGYRSRGLTITTPRRREHVTSRKLDDIIESIKQNKLGPLNRLLRRRARHNEDGSFTWLKGGLDSYCSKCRAVYCQEHYKYFSPIDALEEEIGLAEGVCPKNHEILVRRQIF